MPQRTPLSETQKLKQAAFGGQNELVIVSVPSGASNALVGVALVDAGVLTVAGDYDVLVPLSGFVSKVEVHLLATIAAGTVTSQLNTTYFIADAGSPSTWVAKTAGTGAGALTTATRQSSYISTIVGEQFAWLRLTIAGGSPSVTFTQAEYNGC